MTGQGRGVRFRYAVAGFNAPTAVEAKPSVIAPAAEPIPSPEPTSLPAPESSAAQTDTATGIEFSAATGNSDSVDPVLDALDRLVDALAEAVSDRVAAAIKTKLAARVSNVADVVTRHANETAVRKPKVVIVGLTPQQAGIIRQEFADALTIETVESDNLRKLNGDAHAENVFVNVSFVSHKVTESLQANKVTFTKFGGGLAQLRGMLEKVTAA